MALSRLLPILGALLLTHIPQLQGTNVICQPQSYTTINDLRRSTAYIVNRTAGERLICDVGFIKDGSWYRFDSLAGNEMPTADPGYFGCGTYAPIWMDGTHPTNLWTPVTRKACVSLPWHFPKGCGVSWNIKVINCDGFYLYELKEPGQCNLGYCAGSKLPKACSTTGDTLPVCPGVFPRISKIQAGIKDETGTTAVRLRCFWEYKQRSKNVKFHVRWYGDEKNPKHKIERKFNGTEEREYLFKPVIWKGIRDLNHGYEFQKQVFCQIRARYKNGNWSKWMSSNRIFTGISVYPTEIPMNDCGEKDREVIITLRPHLPIRLRPLKIDIFSPKSSLIDAICVVGHDDVFRHCGIVFGADHRVGDPLRIKLMTNCPAQTANERSTLYKFSVNVGFGQNEFWFSHKFPSIKITKRSFERKECYSTGDPHFKTFDGQTYDFMGRGTFLLYRNNYTGTEIQARQRACWTTPSCNCGVAIKERLFYKIYDMCHQDTNRPWWQGSLRDRFRKSYLRDFKLSRFYTNVKSDGSSMTYEVSLPSGVVVIVQRYSWGLNLNVQAPADPDHPSEGLCGDNNGKAGDDFGQWNSPNAFGEHWRIRNQRTVFDYSGDKFREDRIDDGCGKQICVCKRGAQNAICGADAEGTCFPKLRVHNRDHHKDSGIGECKNRPKRAVETGDDTVDDQDTIPAFNPQITNITFVPKWPTSIKGLTQANVTSFCNKKLRYSQAGETCGKITGVDIDTLVQQCITDIQLTEDFSWAASNFASLETSCVTNVYKNISFFKNTTSGKVELKTEVLASLCPNDCSDHGKCSNSTCTCDEDYTSADCSISLKDSPIIFGIRKSGLCDVRRRPCRNVGIYGFPLLDSRNLTCHVVEYKVIDSPWIPQNSISLYPGLLVDLTEVKCTLPASPVNIGDYGNEGITAAGLKIAVSNNRINASKVSMLFITFDSVCQECNTTAGCKLKTEACLISGHCFAQNQSHFGDWCQQCLPEISTTSWTERRDNQEPIFQTSKVLYAFQGKALQVQLRADDPENRTFRFTFEQNETVGASLTENGLFTWTPTTNSSTSFVFKVTDECGAYSVLNASVVIKQCPCVNNGECQPNYLSLDGSGQFTCLCKPEYNGTLCDLDVNECLSTPCGNGTCKNEQPGFSCSCNPGYTGILCDTDINECLSSPCFLGVQCYDMVNGYSCGPCPKGYTGTGETCSRIDGKTDECIKSPQVCHKNAKCMYNNGSYTCQCQNGYSGDGKTNCTDINECRKSPAVCHQNANCTNIEGNYSCQCSRGYTGDGTVNCTDINECIESPDVCHQHAICSNTGGSYSCQCKVGYTGDGNVHCTDINECTASSNICHQNANCTNTEGSYSCHCIAGYSGDGKINCTDINECTTSVAVCHQYANCTNTKGSFLCQCTRGYSGDGKVNCADINECNESPDVCHQHATCTNTGGSYYCQCTSGYSGDGKLNCTDINECTAAPDVCHQNATCTNTGGSYSCECVRGYLGDGKVDCTENIPPRFTTPSEVYAILDKELQIQIKAVDPESRDMKYSLLPNGTIKTVQLSIDGLLTIPTVKKTGNVYVKVEDKVGGQSVHILQVIAVECPCKHDGSCYLSKSSPYPVNPADYLCKCKAPYTGALCESPPDPCNEVPCFPGLKCLAVKNNDGYTCEECPVLFEGDGKTCTLKNTPDKSSLKSQMTLTSQEWNDQLANKASTTYKKLVSQVTKEIRKVYIGHAEFSYVIIKGFKRGSVVVEFELIFTKKVDNPLEPLQKVVKTGKLGNMTIQMKNLDEEQTGKDDKKIIGLDQTIFIVIVVASVLLILMISFAIYLRVRKIKTHRNAKLSRKVNPGEDSAQPKGLLFQPSVDEPEGVMQEIGLTVLNKEAVLHDELKENP